MLPSKGLCHAIFLLVRSAVLRARPNVTEWIDGARSQSTIMAAALDLEGAAAAIESLGFLGTHPSILIKSPLASFGDVADKATLIGIARLILSKHPPNWIGLAVSKDLVSREYIPTADLLELSWLGDDLDQLLIELAKAHRKQSDDLFLAIFGHIGELVVLESERSHMDSVLHASKISDSFGYDIESRRRSYIRRIEVKTAVSKTASNFYVTRNEYEKARRYQEQWILVQVVLSSSSLLRDQVSQQDVQGARYLQAKELCALIPEDTSYFAWADSAKICPPNELWKPFDVHLPLGWKVDVVGVKNSLQTMVDRSA